MPETMVVTSMERPVLGFALARAVAFYSGGTSEQRESAESLARMLEGLEATPAGSVEMEFLRQDAYLLGIRLFYISIELENFLDDARDQAQGREVDPPDAGLASAVAKYFPDLDRDPLAFQFDPIRGVFTDLGFKLDRLVTDLAPRARAMYNHDREEMSDKANALREQRERRSLEQPAVVRGGVAVATPDTGGPTPEWGVEFSTGLTSDDIPAGSFRVLTVGSARILLTNFEGNLAAIDGFCSHQRANLSKGRVDGAKIECPRHGATFDLRNGEELCPPFCEVWMDRHGLVGKLIALATPDKAGGDLWRYPLRIENNEIILRV
jgi:3-phenylpropionate/trans-cinnamate dioxygenase ferredoxin component